MRKLLLIFILFFTTNIFAQEVIDLQWNRYVVGNFTIMSIDNNQGKWLSQNISRIKSWAITRWGFNDVPFTKECRIFCVPNQELLKKLFNLSESKCEVKDGVIAMWLVLDKESNISRQLTTAYFYEYDKNIPYFAQKGISILNSADSRNQLVFLADVIKRDKNVFVSERMFNMTEQEYKKLKFENQKVFDVQSVALCLMLRKEFGEVKFQRFVHMSSEDGLRNVYGFRNFKQFDKSYIAFMTDLSNDIISSRMPESYLFIERVKR